MQLCISTFKKSEILHTPPPEQQQLGGDRSAAYSKPVVISPKAKITSGTLPIREGSPGSNELNSNDRYY